MTTGDSHSLQGHDVGASSDAEFLILRKINELGRECGGYTAHQFINTDQSVSVLSSIQHRRVFQSCSIFASRPYLADARAVWNIWFAGREDK